MADDTPGRDGAPSPEDMDRPQFGWSTLLQWSVVALVVVIAIINLVVAGQIIPPLVLLGVILIVGLVLLRRRGRAGVILLGIVAALMLLLNAPSIIDALGVPASVADFVVTLAAGLLQATVVVSSVQLLRRADDRPGNDGAKGVAVVAVGVLVVGVLVSLVARVTLDEPASQEDDLQLVAEDNRFSSEQLEGTSGSVTVFVENKDVTYHTFTVESLDVDLEVPGGATGRVTFQAEPGSYEFVCTPHEEEMSGVLTLE